MSFFYVVVLVARRFVDRGEEKRKGLVCDHRRLGGTYDEGFAGHDGFP
jgi:hypothetical protein